MIKEQSTYPKRTVLNFGEGRKQGIQDVLQGKGLFFSCTYFFMTFLFISMFVFLFPFNVEIDFILMRLFLLIAFSAISFLFFKTVIEIVAEEDNLQFRTFRKFHKFLVDKISSISIYNFSSWGIISIYIKADYDSSLYIVWAPNFERERHKGLLDFVDYLKEKPKLTGKIKGNM